ncbi:hypothetical protein D3C71_449070 [compost metagenome]
MTEGLGDFRESEKGLIRDDLWWVTEKYMSLACAIVAEQFIQEQNPEYANAGVLVERINYVMRTHCPIIYGYFFDRTGNDVLPAGTIAIIIELIKAERPLFAVGGITLGQLDNVNAPTAKGKGYMGQRS